MNLEVELIAGVLKGGPPPPHLPAPRLIKIFIAGERDEFPEERKQLLEMVGPELQSIYDDMGIEVLLVDMQYGTTRNPDCDPRLAELFLEEIKASHRYSRGCFFILLIGTEYSTGWVPIKFDEAVFRSLAIHCDQLNEYYVYDNDCYTLKATSVETSQDDWQTTVGTQLRVLLTRAAKSALKDDSNNAEIINILKSTSERQLDYGLKLDEGGKGILSMIRRWKDSNTDEVVPKLPVECEELIAKVKSSLPARNVIELDADYHDNEINPTDHPNHDCYLANLRNQILEVVQQLVNESVEANPEIKSRKKLVQEIYAESLAHLSLMREITPVDENNDIVQRVKKLLIAGKTNKHGPIFIREGKLSSKSGTLRAIYDNSDNWLKQSTMKIVRFCTSTPRSAYSLELLRVLCQHIGFLFGNNDGNLPREASFNPLYLNNWLIQILRGIEENQRAKVDDDDNFEQLIVIIDDLHRLHPLEGDIVAALSWLPLQLPPGIHFIISSSAPLDSLKLTPLQKERFKCPEILIDMSAKAPDTAEDSTPRMTSDIEKAFDYMEKLIGVKAASRIGSFLACTEYGLSETEVLELIMPTGGDDPLELAAGQFNFATWCLVRRNLISCLRVRVMSGRLLFSWHWLSREVAEKRYLSTQQLSRACYTESAKTIFFVEPEVQKKDSNETDDNDEKTEAEQNGKADEKVNKETPFNSTPQISDITYTLRHVEEAWLHLLRSGDGAKLKRLTVCAFDFLLAAVQMISVSYLRCVLEDSRRYLLERDVELVYYTIRNSSDALTRDPLQLGGQLICWLRPVVRNNDDLVTRMITTAMAWCDGCAAPLLVPLNGWLQSPLPLQIRVLTCPQGVKLVEVSPTGQQIIIVGSGDAGVDVQLWHVMSGQLVHTFKGHTKPISCLSVTQQAQYLLTGSEDTTIIVWDMKELTMKRRICEHIAPVLTLTPALKNSVIVSGGEDSRIIATSLLSGQVLMIVDHHRGPITAVRVDAAGEVLVSGSADGTVCLWSLESFKLLNSITLASPVSMLDVSVDSVFLLAVCEDQKLYVRSLATGTALHTLRGHQGAVKSICIARDCRRAVAGGTDGRVSIFDIHSGKLLRTLSTNSLTDVTSVRVTDTDDFLITASGNRLIYWSFRDEETIKKNCVMDKEGLYKPKQQQQLQQHQISLQYHTSPLTCIDISRDGAMAVTGSVDSLVNLWQLNTHELMLTMEGHIATVTCVAFSASGLFAASGSEDKTVRVWGLTLGLAVATFKHQAPVTSVIAMLDGQRVVSSDRSGVIRVWAADTGVLIQSVCGPGRCIAVTPDMRYTICGSGDNQVRIMSLGAGPMEKHQVSHGQDITCLVVTPDSNSLITGSCDMSLKVWQLAGGKLSQVLVGHTDRVTCVAVSVQDQSIVVSGSRDANLIVWDINTGSDLHTLSGHLGCVTCVRLSGDGTLAVSGSEDKNLFVWDTKKGIALGSIMLHVPILGVEISTDCSRLAIHLIEQPTMPILCLHNTPAQYVKLPVYVAPRELRPLGPKRPARRLLKKEVSLDTYTWQRKYGHLTSGIMVATAEDPLKRRFSVSASMEEISKVGLDSQTSLARSQQAALAQSQHFDQLEALWNKQSPPPRSRGTSGRTLAKQSSLQATRISDSDEENDLAD
ncbi:protein qui-1 [Diachasmimorpha longicaudata]